MSAKFFLSIYKAHNYSASLYTLVIKFCLNERASWVDIKKCVTCE